MLVSVVGTALVEDVLEPEVGEVVLVRGRGQGVEARVGFAVGDGNWCIIGAIAEYIPESSSQT